MSGRNIDDVHWRDSAREVRFFIWDGKTAFPMVLFLMHISMWTFVVAITATTFFSVLKHYGITVDVFFRRFRCLLSGPRKAAQPWWDK